MPYVVVDTCVVSYFFNGHTLEKSYYPYLEGNTPAISFMTLAELHYGALKSNWGESRYNRLIEHATAAYLVYPFNPILCTRWAEVRVQIERVGRSISVADAWVAATALVNDAPLITHNRRHFEAVEGLMLLTKAP